jgi:hypothetical protein
MFLGMMFCGSTAAAQGTQVALRLTPGAINASTVQKPKRGMASAGETVWRGVALPRPPQTFQVELPRATAATAPRPRLDAPAALAPLRVTAERSRFLTEARIPIAQMWSGRLQFSGVQQRFHDANLYSALNPAFWAEVAAAPGVERIGGRARVNYGVGVQVRFGR